MQNTPKKISLNFPKELSGGVYANHMAVTQTREEFIMDFLMVAPPSGSVNARVIVSPGHAKRIVKVLQENIAKYEKRFGIIQTIEEPEGDVTLQ